MTTSTRSWREHDEVIAAHASAFETLRSEHPELLREIEDEDRVWERSDLSSPPS